MSASSLRGWMLGLALAVGSGAGSYLAVSHGQEAQEKRFDQMAEELQALRKAVMARPPAPAPSSGRAVAAGIPPTLQSGEARLRPEDLDAIAARMVTQLQQSGALESSAREPGPPPPPAPLEPEQQQALARANSLVDRVLSTGKLTMQDTQEIRREMALLKSRQEAEEVRRRIIVALNKNQLDLPEGPEALP
ncbi:MAG: hypothetical protein JXB05_15165 [Myxococcaceae bacterium]|nr:hypothetical protein [Myxococcaceae bacterium]